MHDGAKARAQIPLVSNVPAGWTLKNRFGILLTKYLPQRLQRTKKNIISERNELSNFKEINNRIAKWLKNNTPFTGIRDLRENFEGKSKSLQLNEFLDSIKEDV